MSYANMDSVPTQTSGVSEVLASDWNTYVRDNFDAIKFGHVVVANDAAKSALTVAEGTMVYQSDNNKVFVYSGSAWVEVNNLSNAGALETTVAGQLGLNQLGTTRRVTASYAPETTTTSTTLTEVTGFNFPGIETSGEGFITGLFTAELKNDSPTSGLTYGVVQALSSGANVQMQGSAIHNLSGAYTNAWASAAIVQYSTYRKVSLMFEYIPTFYGSGTTTDFKVYVYTSTSSYTAYIKNITLSTIWTSF